MNVLLLLVTAVLFSFVVLFIFRNRQNGSYQAHFMLIVFLGLFQLLFGHTSSVLYAQRLYLVLTFPLPLLYGPAFLLLLHDFEKTKESVLLKKNLIPFYFTSILFVILAFYTPFQQEYHHEYAFFLYFLTLIQFLGYGIMFQSFLMSLLKKSTLSLFRKLLWGGLFVLLIILSLHAILKMIENSENIILNRNALHMLYLLFLVSTFFFLQIRFSIQEDLVKPIGMRLRGKGKNAFRKIIIISREKEVVYKNNVENFIETLAFLDTDLNKDKFCKLVEIPIAHVSLFLKQEFGKSYNGFINQLRLNYAARQLRADDMLYTIDDLAINCGFNSRASFYRNFQQEFGCTPHQFRFNKKA